ncbi:hypothetical protein BAE44_0015974 [Dichanthelium oligosanthes]|uniref:F-box domain-containing protein n=1 Tax=Dichanthelium oligosanthes TaxID=888268 RepID=A0A1E5VCX5_9POAL|nr:hypothetical protein BAE44_0015974 [Dichanthelium oligosanthes]
MGGEDRLSALSDDLLRRILYFVPSKEAGSTSVLSRRWGSLWRSSGAVNLAVRVTQMSRYGQPSQMRREAKEASFSHQEAFVRAAAAALDAAEAPITRLTLHVETHDDDTDINQFLHGSRDRGRIADGDVVGALLSHPEASRIEELRVALVVTSDVACLFSGTEIGRTAGIYKVVSLPSATTLRVLDLTRCDLAPLAPAAFPRLATLRLRLCSLQPKDLQALSDAAPELTTVHLESVLFTLRPQFQDTQRFLHYHYQEFDGNTSAEPPVVGLCFQAVTTLVLALCGKDAQGGRSNSWAIEIDAPMLRSFVYKGLLRRFLLRSASPDIAQVDLHFLHVDADPRHGYYNEDDYDKERTRELFWQFVKNFTNARTLGLKVDDDLKEIAAIGKARRAKLLCVFPNVGCLELEGVHRPTSKTAAVAIANLLHCCPALRDVMLKLSTVPPHCEKGSTYGRSVLWRKDRLDYSKSIDRFRRRNSKRMAIAMEDSSGDRYDEVAADIPGLSGCSFACLQSSLRKVSLQFRLGDSSSSCFGVRLVKFFAENAIVLDEMCVDTGNRRLREHLNFNVERWITRNSTKASFEHKNPAEGSWEFSKIPSASLDSTTDLGRNATSSFSVLPLQRRTRMDFKY